MWIMRRGPEVPLGEIAFDSTLYRATQFWAYHGLLGSNPEGLVARAGFAPAFRGYEPLVLSYATTARPKNMDRNWSALADDFRTFMAEATWPLPLSDSLVQVFEPRPGP